MQDKSWIKEMPKGKAAGLADPRKHIAGADKDLTDLQGCATRLPGKVRRL